MSCFLYKAILAFHAKLPILRQIFAVRGDAVTAHSQWVVSIEKPSLA